MVDKMDKAPLIGSIYGLVIGGITSFSESWESLYIDVEYWQKPSSGERRAFVKCGESKYCELFKNWIGYGTAKSMKSLHSIWPGIDIYTVPRWGDAVNSFAKDQYAKFKGITLSDSYKYDMEFTFHQRRKEEKYVSEIFCGKDGKMYEYAKIYDGEKIEIVVTDGSRIIDRLNITSMINPVSELPRDKAALFEFVKA